MKKSLAVVAVLALLALALVLAGCQKAGAKAEVVIGFTNWTLGDAFTVELQNGIIKAAAKEGVKVIPFNNEGGKEVDNTRTMLTQGVAGAIMCYWDPNLAKTSIDLLKEKNIPIMAVDIPMPGTVFLGVENYSVGKQGGEYIAKWLKENWGGQIDLLVVINSPTEGELVAKRFQGQEDAILKEIAYPRDRIEYADGGGWAEGALKVTRPILAKHASAQKIAFVVENDPCSIGIITALEEAGKAGNAIMVTQGVQKDTQPLIRGGDSPVKAGVAYFPENYGAQGMPKLLEMVRQLKKGLPVAEAYKAVVKDSIQFAVDNQNYTEPAVYVKTQIVTQANINQFYPESK
jgi:ribose transport system substrate-binding protein